MTAISASVQSVLQLFQGPLAHVRFADIDAAGLSQLAAEVEAAATEVNRQEAAVAELRQTLIQRQDALLGLAQQALAYARVYADNDEALLEELNRITLPRAPKPRKPSSPKAAPARDSAEDGGAGEVAPISEALVGDDAEGIAVAPAAEQHEEPPVAPPRIASSRDGRKARRNGAAQGAAR
jgi:hypothetical protein